MITPPLDETRRRLLAEERGLLGELRDWLVRLGAAEEARRALVGSLEQLDEPFLLVVVGEFNAGKSAFINALLGQGVLEEGITPTTARIGLLRYGEAVGREVTAAGVERLWAPAEVLREIVIVDTPGTNAVLREHEALTRDFVPRADLVLFVTSTERPFTESERAFLEAIREWGKKVVIVLNKADLLEGAGDGDRLVTYVREQAQRTLGFSPEVFPVSARSALRGRLEDDVALVEGSGFPAFEARVTATLDEGERFRLKLQNPIGVARRAHREVSSLVSGRLALLGDDVHTLEAVYADLAARGAELERDLRLRLADVEKVAASSGPAPRAAEPGAPPRGLREDRGGRSAARGGAPRGGDGGLDGGGGAAAVAGRDDPPGPAAGRARGAYGGPGGRPLRVRPPAAAGCGERGVASRCRGVRRFSGGESAGEQRP
jgi:small GTP-binding protein